MADANPTAGELRAAFSYEPDSGHITRINGQRPGHVVGYGGRNGYTSLSYRKRTHLLHRVAWCIAQGAWPTGQIDHINGDKQDNRLCNLRDVSPQVNSQNRHGALRNNRTAMLGVTLMKSGRYMARMLIAGQRHYLGLHETAAAAHEAYKSARIGR